jgi:hypothetical protein
MSNLPEHEFDPTAKPPTTLAETADQHAAMDAATEDAALEPAKVEPVVPEPLLPEPVAINAAQPFTPALETAIDPDRAPAIYVSLEAPQPPPVAVQPLFQNWEQLPPPPAVRTPHLGHVLVLGLMALGGLLVASLCVQLALYAHLFGVSTLKQATSDIHYSLGSEGILYLITFASAFFFFPLFWQRSFFQALPWNGSAAVRHSGRLLLCALLCFLLAMLDGVLLPGPKDAPIDKIFHSPGAPWLLFGFGVTIAPFCEELIFRGFLLPALCTACDWIAERVRHMAPLPLDAEGLPQWSLAAMITGSILTSLPFAALHAAQTGYTVGPFVLLVLVSLVLCGARLLTRSLAASVLVHSAYNFLLFSIMMIGTSGFQHMDKM